MANADITSKATRLNGILSDTSYINQEVHLIDFKELSEIAATGEHDLFKFPKGTAITKITVIAVKGVTSSGAATIQFKLKIGGSAEAVNSSAIGIADLTAGDIHTLDVSNIKAYAENESAVIQLVVGTAALTEGALILLVDSLPVKQFIDRG